MNAVTAPGWPLQTVGNTVNLTDLSGRERDVITMITQGYSNREIADGLFLTVNSVKTYIRLAYRKIGATRRSHAIIWGFQQGLLDTHVQLAGATPAA